MKEDERLDSGVLHVAVILAGDEATAVHIYVHTKEPIQPI
jgi:hypothetical protein